MSTYAPPRDAVPTDRLAVVVNDWIERYRKDHPETPNAFGNQHEFTPLQALKQRSGVADRTLRSILKGTHTFVRLNIADALLCGMEETYLWHMPAELGGLADIYEGAIA